MLEVADVYPRWLRGGVSKVVKVSARWLIYAPCSYKVVEVYQR
jgi:hypothetical protein